MSLATEHKIIGPAAAGSVAEEMTELAKDGWLYRDTVYSGIWGSDQYLKIAVLVVRAAVRVPEDGQ